MHKNFLLLKRFKKISVTVLGAEAALPWVLHCDLGLPLISAAVYSCLST